MFTHCIYKNILIIIDVSFLFFNLQCFKYKGTAFLSQTLIPPPISLQPDVVVAKAQFLYIMMRNVMVNVLE